MNKRNFNKGLIASCVFGGLGVICFIIKLIEFTMRTEHEWAKTFVVLGFVFIGIALIILCAIAGAEVISEKKNGNKDNLDDKELLAKYKSKKNN